MEYYNALLNSYYCFVVVVVKHVLVGVIDSCESSGSLLLQDNTGSLPLILTFDLPPSAKCTQPRPSVVSKPDQVSKLSHLPLGTKVIVTDFVVIFEKTVNLSSTDGPSSDILIYLHLMDFSIVPKSPPSPRKLTPQGSSSFLIRDLENADNKVIYFKTVTKNVPVISAAGHLEFSCRALIRNDLKTPSNKLRRDRNIEEEQEGEGDKGGAEKMKGKEEMMDIVVHFGGAAFKLYPLVQVGHLYEISLREGSCGDVLPCRQVLSKNRLLNVSGDMEVRLVEEGWEEEVVEEGGMERCGSRGCDVADICRRLMFPAFSTRMGSEFNTTTTAIGSLSR